MHQQCATSSASRPFSNILQRVKDQIKQWTGETFICLFLLALEFFFFNLCYLSLTHPALSNCAFKVELDLVKHPRVYILQAAFSSLPLYFSLSGRSNLNLKLDNSSRINCKGGRITTAIISLPAPPDLSPDGDSLHGPVQRRPPLSHSASPSIQTTTSAAGISIIKVSALWLFSVTLRGEKNAMRKRRITLTCPCGQQEDSCSPDNWAFQRRQMTWKHRWGGVAVSCMYCRYGRMEWLRFL